jgi:sulfite exporter TauE/SafE/copper chaperone CopZ
MSQNKYLKVPVKGMHCRSCEILIEENLKEVAHVHSVESNYRTGEVTIHYQGAVPDFNLIKRVVKEAGYEVGTAGSLPFFSGDKQEYIKLGWAAVVLLVLYLVLKSLGLTTINVTPDLGSPSFGLIVMIGLVAGFSTCMALVGGLVLGLSAKFAEDHPQATSTEKFQPHIFFTIGRVLGYAFLGGLLGALGTVLRFSAWTNGLLTLAVGLVMLVMGLQLINIFPRLNKFKLALPKSLSKALGITNKTKVYSHEQTMLLGALTFFLPCGFTQAMQLYAISTGNFAYGALVMGLFALGTAPGLLSIGGLTAVVRGSFKAGFFKVAGLAVIFFALFNLHNGYTLANLGSAAFGNSFNLPTTTTTGDPATANTDPNVTLENGVQVVHMTETSTGYTPNNFTIKSGVPVKWVINAQAPYSCASVILLPKLKIQKFLAAGENIVEFTPTETGQLPFSCSMGMYTGVFNVVTD